MTTEETRDQGQEPDQPASEAKAPARRRRSPKTSAAKGEGTTGSGSTSRRRTTRATAKAKTDSAKPARRRRRPAEKEAAPAAVGTTPPAPRMLEKLRSEIGPVLSKEFGYTSPMQIARLDKIVLNIGLGEALENSRAVEAATKDLTLIAGQRPVTTRARKSIAGFKLRQGVPLGIMVTLRGRRMYEFLDRLISSALPRIRDFQGLSREAFDGRGNYSIGIREQVIFPEIDYNAIDRMRGLQVVIVTTARTDREALRLLELMGMPFVRRGDESLVA